MKLFAVLVLALGFSGCAHQQQDAQPPQLSLLEVQEQNMRAKYLGKTKEALRAVFGIEVAGQFAEDTWEIWDRLHPGANSSVFVTQFKFKNDIAVELSRYAKPVGCILAEPAR